MPKTAEKRARARRVARVARAHQTTIDHPLVRRTRTSSARTRPQGLNGFISRYPLLTSIVTLLIVAGIAGFLYGNKLGPFTKPVHQPSCNLKTHVCEKPNMTIDLHKVYVATIKTARGDIVFEMYPTQAPITINNFVYLATQHFYDGLTFWRVDHKGQPSAISNGQPSTLDVIQGGDPKGDGTGGPGYSFKDEKVVGTYTAGCVAMANSGVNTNGSQFFICTGDDTSLPKSFNLFGQVTSGLDVAQKIQPKDKIISVTITSMPAPTPAPATPTATAAPTATTGR
jgi:cyclophilin family peptidyl-prolyl cis-trans isomerase